MLLEVKKMALAEKAPKEENDSEEIEEGLKDIVNAVVEDLKTVNDYQVPKYEDPTVSFKPGINSALHFALKKYLEAKIYAFRSEF